MQEWKTGGAEGLSPATKQALLLLYERFRKETFADWQRLESEIATDLEEWQRQALPVGANEANQELLVGAVKTLLQVLQADARSRLDEHLTRYEAYERRSSRLTDVTTRSLLRSAWRSCALARWPNCCASRRSSGWNQTKPRSCTIACANWNAIPSPI